MLVSLGTSWVNSYSDHVQLTRPTILGFFSAISSSSIECTIVTRRLLDGYAPTSALTESAIFILFNARSQFYIMPTLRSGQGEHYIETLEWRLNRIKTLAQQSGMSLFGIKKPSRRQFRKRVVVDEEEDEKEEEGGQPNTAANEVNPKAVEVSR